MGHFLTANRRRKKWFQTNSPTVPFPYISTQAVCFPMWEQEPPSFRKKMVRQEQCGGKSNIP
jgi:hypothetical protein